MNLDFLSLKAKHQPKDFTLNIYPADFEKFSKFVEFINKGKSVEESISPEDIFEELMKATDQVEGFSEFCVTPRRGRKKNPSEN